MDTEGYSPQLPLSVAVRFPAQRCDGAPQDLVSSGNTVRWYTSTVQLSSVISGLPIQPPSATVGTPQVKSFKDTANANYFSPLSLTGSNPAPTNQSALDTLANQIATDFYNYRSYPFDRVYNGVVALTPNALFDEIIIDYCADDVKTRVKSAIPSGEPEELGHEDPDVTSCPSPGTLPFVEMYVPKVDNVGGQCSVASLAVALVGIVDGRLKATYKTTEVHNCSASSICTGYVCFHSYDGCNSSNPVSAVTGQLTSGGVTFSCVGDTNGNCCIQLTGTGASAQYVVTAIPPFNEAPQTATVNLNPCSASITASFQFFGNPNAVRSVFVGPTLCDISSGTDGNCKPTNCMPITVTWSQTSGGTNSGSITLNSSLTSTTLFLPPGTYLFTASAPYHNGVSQTITIPNCAAGSGFAPKLKRTCTDLSLCSPAACCCEDNPSAIHITFDSSVVWCGVAGTTVTLSRCDNQTDSAQYTACVTPVGGGGCPACLNGADTQSFAIVLNINAASCKTGWSLTFDHCGSVDPCATGNVNPNPPPTFLSYASCNNGSTHGFCAAFGSNGPTPGSMTLCPVTASGTASMPNICCGAGSASGGFTFSE